MKAKITMIVAVITLFVVSCGDMGYKKTKSGLVYKIIPGGGKDSVAKMNNVVKFNFIRKINDSLIYSSYGKMPGFTVLNADPSLSYSPLEVMFEMRKGDSAVTIEIFDTLIKKGMQAQMPFGKKGDRVKTYVKILEIFKNDSVAKVDFDAEMAKDKPRQEQEMKEMQAKEAEKAKEQQAKEMEQLKKSGELAKQEKEVEDYLAAKKITATKAPGGTYVLVKDKGAGEPTATGKFITVQYAGRLLANDTAFEASQYIFPLGQSAVIRGWDDGITLFNKGGKGTLYVPGYLAYGSRPGPGGKPNEALIFDIEIVNISNTQQEAYAAKSTADSLAAAKTTKKVK